MVRREVLRVALVPVHLWVSTCDGSRELSHGPFVWVVDAISLFYGFITTSLFILCLYMYGGKFYIVCNCVMYFLVLNTLHCFV